MKLSIIFIIWFFVPVIFSNFAFAQAYEQKFLCEGESVIGFKYENNSWVKRIWKPAKYIVNVINLGKTFEVKKLGGDYEWCSSEGNFGQSIIDWFLYAEEDVGIIRSFKINMKTLDFLSGDFGIERETIAWIEIGQCTSI